MVRRIRRPLPAAAPFVNVIYQDRAGTLWIGVVTAERPGALYCLRDGKLERISGISGVSHMIEDRDGRDRKISAPPGNNTFDFRFAALSLSAPERCASSTGSNHTTTSG
ncbi:MAG TPA: two-component regulator propeller domain-containing protein [Candidatus Binatia bacterium]|nr:two-component regulator propeller domain-containing protein [Candidatus Binatia bacterium]